MKIGILQTGDVNEALAPKYGAYPGMFARLLRPVDPDIETPAYAVLRDEFPASVDECDGWIVTGSRHGVYENLPWMLRLQAFLRDAYAAGVPIVGICFGHQILAEALGGKVEKSGKGWGCGVHGYQTIAPAPWMQDAPDTQRLHCMHQDQIAKLPEDARVIASSEFCDYAMLDYGGKAFSMQAHPEFEGDYTADIVKMRRGSAIPEPVAQAALDSIGGAVDSPLAARWIVDFFRHAVRT